MRQSARHLVKDLHIKTFIPVRVQSFLDDASRVGLFRIDGDDGERVRKTEDVALGQAIRSDHCEMV